jgi:hypothetical protein
VYAGYQRSVERRLEPGDILFQTDRYATVLTPGYRGEAVNLQDPRVAEGLRLTLDMLGTMQVQSAAAGTRFAVLLLPTKELALAETVKQQMATVPESYATLVADEAAARLALQQELTARHIAVVDALPALRALLAGGVLPYSTTRDGHLNPAGQLAVAELLGNSVLASLSRSEAFVRR